VHQIKERREERKAVDNHATYLSASQFIKGVRKVKLEEKRIIMGSGKTERSEQLALCRP